MVWVFLLIILSVDIIWKDKVAQLVLLEHVIYFFHNHGVQEREQSQKPRLHYWSKGVANNTHSVQNTVDSFVGY